MNLIELDNCFVQPQAILKIAKGKEFGQILPPGVEPSFDTEDEPYLMLPVLFITLTSHEKITLKFADADSRDIRFSEIVEQMRVA